MRPCKVWWILMRHSNTRKLLEAPYDLVRFDKAITWGILKPYKVCLTSALLLSSSGFEEAWFLSLFLWFFVFFSLFLSSSLSFLWILGQPRARNIFVGLIWWQQKNRRAWPLIFILVFSRRGPEPASPAPMAARLGKHGKRQGPH